MNLSTISFLTSLLLITAVYVSGDCDDTALKVFFIQALHYMNETYEGIETLNEQAAEFKEGKITALDYAIELRKNLVAITKENIKNGDTLAELTWYVFDEDNNSTCSVIKDIYKLLKSHEEAESLFRDNC